MSKLIYITNMSLDGYIEDETGAFDWDDNPEQLHPYIIDLLRPIGTYMYGRRLYETMAYWEGPVEDYPPQYRDFARLWHNPEKIVFSRTLTAVTTRNTRLEREFDVDAIRERKRTSSRDISIGGAQLASLALEADLVDECHLFVHPVILGGGKPAFQKGLREKFELLDLRRISTRVIHLHYRVSAESR